MAKRYTWLSFLIILPAALILGCAELGKVDQGRVVEFDSAKGIVTLIQDKRAEPGNPDYNTLPPHVYRIPEDPYEMGPEPKAGRRMKLDTKAKVITIFDPKTQAFQEILYTLIDQREGVPMTSPLVARKEFPLIDKEKKTITIYSSRQRVLVTFTVPEEFMALPREAWEAGDEVRVYYKEEGKALRLMNITQTDIFKK
ncbi:MAG: DUF4881 domain-containing protein [Deltaproteobacteria bacterium]|nr:DUF4881 domain-containing protein [Deltaproteobacteria bacterium]